MRAATAPRRLPRNPAARLPHGDTTLPFATAWVVAIAARRQEGREEEEEEEEHQHKEGLEAAKKKVAPPFKKEAHG